jgi:hypothetical protein
MQFFQELFSKAMTVHMPDPNNGVFALPMTHKITVHAGVSSVLEDAQYC